MARTSSTPPPTARPGSGKAAATPEKKPRWYKQVWDAYQMARQHDPAVTWWIVGAFVGVLAVGAVIGALTHNLFYFLVLAIPFALLAGMYTLARRAETAAYGRIEGQPGAALAALGTIRRGWSFGDEPVAVDPRTNDLVFRGLGRPGIVLISEGPSSRAEKLLEAERKRTARVASGVPITLIQMGNDEGQVPLRKLPRAVRKLKPKLTKAEIAVVSKRLTALGAARLPIPKGIDPMRARPDRKGLRGR